MADQHSKGHFYACGFNAFGQLNPGTYEDIYSFQKLPGPAKITKLLFSGWSETTLFDSKTSSEGGLIRYGSTNKDHILPISDPILGVGDHNGMLVILDTEGRIGFVRKAEGYGGAENSGSHNDVDRPRIAHLAIAGNGHVAAVPHQPNNSTDTQILVFSSFEQFKQWYTQPGTDYAISSRHTLAGQVAQLVANAIAFVCLTRDGNVYTWGDARHGSLGRSTNPEAPGIVESLSGLKVVKLAASGWITAALSADGAAYLFGATTPGTENLISCLRGLDPEQAALVEIMDDVEPLDVLDIAVGNEHVVILVEGGRVFVVGENRNGQLGLGEGGVEFVEEWTEVELPNGRRCVAVSAGPKCSFIRLEDTSAKGNFAANIWH